MDPRKKERMERMDGTVIRELAEKSRSCRGYAPTEVKKETLTKLTDCARLCPSGGNLQALRYKLSWESETNDRVLKATRWGAALPERHLPDPGKGARAYIVICLDTAAAAEATPAMYCDVGIAAQTICLAAAEKGLASLMIMNFSREGVANALSIDGRFRPLLVIALGVSAEKTALEERKEGMPPYWRDENDVHHVPKWQIEKVII